MIAVHNHIRGEEQVEKLVLEIAEKMFGDVDEYTRAIARESITLIGKAYADGMPLPGEVGPRWEQYVYPCHEFADWCEEMYEADAKTLIALSPSGIPVEHKEEEE